METEFVNAIRTILVGDATLTDLLGASYGIYANQIPDEVTYPALRIWFVTDMPVRENSSTGEFKPLVQIDIFSGDPAVTSQIRDRMDQLLETPRNRAARIESTNYKCDLFVRQQGLHRFTNVRRDDVKIDQTVTEWRATILSK